jgi:hypothetical protein
VAGRDRRGHEAVLGVGSSPVLRRTDRVVARVRGPPRRDRPAGAHRPGLADACAQVSGPGVPVLGVRTTTVAQGPPHRALGEWRTYRSGKPGPPVSRPSPVGARKRVENQRPSGRGVAVPRSDWTSPTEILGARTSRRVRSDSGFGCRLVISERPVASYPCLALGQIESVSEAGTGTPASSCARLSHEPGTSSASSASAISAK